MRIIISGYTGKMGRMLEEAVLKNPELYQTVAEYAPGAERGKPHAYSQLGLIEEEADVLIDFSSHLATEAVCNYCEERGIPAVICTTGQTAAEKKRILSLSKHVPVFMSGNMSLGIAVLSDLVQTAVKMFPDADVEIVEKHHNQKIDVPSGTALMLAKAVQEERPDSVINIGRHLDGKRDPREIGIHSLRMGNEVGTHEVYINTGNECLTLCHEAQSRAVFADGALKAASFLVQQKPGFYTMKELLKG